MIRGLFNRDPSAAQRAAGLNAASVKRPVKLRPEWLVAITAALSGVIVGVAISQIPPREAIAILVALGASCLTVLVLDRTINGGNLLSAREATYRSFFEHAIEGVFRTTPDGRYLDANPALARIYGYESPAALIAGLTDIAGQLYVDSNRRAEFQSLMKAHDRVTAFESEIRRHDGVAIWISENARAVRDWNGDVICYEGTVEDVTERHVSQRKLRAALTAAEEASRAKSAFLAAMSHELKTPLNAVLGFSDIIRNEMLGPIAPPRYKTYVEDIHAGGARLLAIINDILDVARLSGGAISLVSRSYPAAKLLSEAVSLARSATLDQREIGIDVQNLNSLVDVDPQRLRQALANLVSNALKFTPDGGEVRVSSGLTSSGETFFVVRDRGIGMASETVAAALEPFRQLDRSLARRFEGTGLGLSICKSLVELHGGVLAVESTIGAGTTVTMTLPAVRTRPRETLAVA